MSSAMSMKELSRRTGIPFQTIRRETLILIGLLSDDEKSKFLENYEE